MEEMLSEEQKRIIRQMLEGEAWKIVRGRLEQLLIKRERAKAEKLRQLDLNLALRLQGIVDGIEECIDTVERLAERQQAENEGPIY